MNMFERKEEPKVDAETAICEVCGAFLLTAQERILRRCPNHISK